jgi:hypothetical protein
VRVSNVLDQSTDYEARYEEGGEARLGARRGPADAVGTRSVAAVRELVEHVADCLRISF